MQFCNTIRPVARGAEAPSSEEFQHFRLNYVFRKKFCEYVQFTIFQVHHSHPSSQQQKIHFGILPLPSPVGFAMGLTIKYMTSEYTSLLLQDSPFWEESVNGRGESKNRMKLHVDMLIQLKKEFFEKAKETEGEKYVCRGPKCPNGPIAKIRSPKCPRPKVSNDTFGRYHVVELPNNYLCGLKIFNPCAIDFFRSRFLSKKNTAQSVRVPKCPRPKVSALQVSDILTQSDVVLSITAI